VEDNFTAACDTIKRDLKPFLEDLLKEEEYQAFLAHLEQCTKCKEYVRSVDSFSNQLWKLGDVKVPSDFCSTVLFKLEQPKEEIREAEPRASKKFPVGIFASVFAITVLVLGISIFYILKKAPKKEMELAQVPVSAAPGEADREPVQDGEVEPRSDDPKQEDAVVFEAEGSVTGGPFTQENNVMAYFEPGGATGIDNNAAAQTPKWLHWHFLRYNKSEELEALRLRREERNVAAKLRQDQGEMKKLEAEPPSAELTQKIEQKKSSIKDLEDQYQEIKVKLEQSLKEKSRIEGEPQNILGTLDIKLDYQDDDFLLFTANGRDIVDVLKEIAFISERSSPLRDFTPLTSSPNTEYRGSIFIEREKTSVEHWHVNLTMPNQGAQLLQMIREKGGMITYQSEDEITFSISNSGMEQLKAQMPAMRISLSEYGNQENRSGEPTGEGTVISIYFSK
jgi:hypothetical protein